MHDILVGALQYEVKLMLNNMIEVNQYFSLGMHNLYNTSLLHYIILTSLDLFNTRLSNTEVGYMEASDKCSRIDATILFSNGHTLRQTGTHYK